MKRILVSLTLVTASICVTKAQNNRLGLKGGLNASSLKTTGGGTTFNSDSKIGFYAGAFAQLGVAQNFAVQPEIMYSLLGARYKFSNVTVNRNLSYISVPLLVSYIKEGLSIVAGPQISFLVAANDKGTNISTDIKSQFTTTEIAGVIGAGYTTINGFGFDARYQLGLTDIAKGNSSGFKFKNNNFQFGVHYLLHHY